MAKDLVFSSFSVLVLYTDVSISLCQAPVEVILVHLINDLFKSIPLKLKDQLEKIAPQHMMFWDKDMQQMKSKDKEMQ